MNGNEEKLSEEESIKKSIKELEHRAKYSKNPLEARQLRSRIGKLQIELKKFSSK